MKFVSVRTQTLKNMSLTYLNENSVECIDDTIASGNFAKLIAKYGICGDEDKILDVCYDLKVIFILAVIQVSLVIVQPIVALISLLVSKIRCRKNRSVEPIDDYVEETTEYKEENTVEAIQLEKVEETKSVAGKPENDENEDEDTEIESEDETYIESDSSDDDCGCFPKRKKDKNDEVEVEQEIEKEITKVEVFDTKEESKDVESVYSVLSVEEKEDVKVLAASSSSLGLLILMSFVTGIIEIIIYRKLFTKLIQTFLL